MVAEVEITDAEDLQVWNAAAQLSNVINSAIQYVRQQAGDELLTEVVVRGLALHVFAVRARYDVSAEQFEERIAAIPEQFRERILVLAVGGAQPKVRG